MMATLHVTSLNDDYMINVESSTGSISSIKHQIEEMTGIQEKVQNYFHSGHRLIDNDLYDTRVMNFENPLQLAEERIKVTIKLPSGQEFSNYFTSNATIHVVIQKINEDLGINFPNYELFCEGCSEIERSKYQYISKHDHINSEASFRLTEIENGRLLYILAHNHLGEESVLRDIPSNTTIYDIMWMICLEKRDFKVNKYQLTSDHRFISKNVNKTLEELNIEAGNLVLLSPIWLGGGMCGEGLNFNDMQNQVKLKFTPDAPKWRIVQKGISFFGKCKNENCEAYNHQVIHSIGYGVFTLGLLRCHCPMSNCQASIDAENCGFYKAKWKFVGVTSTGEGKEGSGESKEYCFTTFKEGNDIQWRGLKIEAQELV